MSDVDRLLLRCLYPLAGVLIGGLVTMTLWLLTDQFSRTPYLTAFAAGFTTVFILSILGWEEGIAKNLLKRSGDGVKVAKGDLIVAKQRNIVVTALVDLSAAISELPWE